jgi:hypothetical protein
MTGHELIANLQALTQEQLNADVCVRTPRDGMIYDLQESVSFADVKDGEIVGDEPTCLILEL